MNEQPFSPQHQAIPNEEIYSRHLPQERDPAVETGNFLALGSREAADEQRGYGRPRENRRGSSGRSKNRGSRNHRSSRHSGAQEPGRQFLILGCVILGGIGILLLGFYLGQKKEKAVAAANQFIQHDAEMPSSKSQPLLDAGFESMQNGNFREAMIDFQKVQNFQPALVGIDYLLAEAAFKAGENEIAQESARYAISKNEFSDQARVLLDIIDIINAKSSKSGAPQLTDPQTNEENDIKNYAASHLGDARAYAIWGDFLRAGGAYRSAIDVFHEGLLRTDPEASREVLSAKEQLTRLQNETAKVAPSLSEVTSMSGEQALVAALASLQLHKSEEAVVFLEKARDLYPPQIFSLLIEDNAFGDFRNDAVMKEFFKKEMPASAAP